MNRGSGSRLEIIAGALRVSPASSSWASEVSAKHRFRGFSLAKRNGPEIDHRVYFPHLMAVISTAKH